MSGTNTSPHKIVKLRTFADDVRRARERSTHATDEVDTPIAQSKNGPQQSTPPETTSSAEPESASLNETLQKGTDTPSEINSLQAAAESLIEAEPETPAHPTKSDTDGTIIEDNIVVPPFHSLRHDEKPTTPAKKTDAMADMPSAEPKTPTQPQLTAEQQQAHTALSVDVEHTLQDTETPEHITGTDENELEAIETGTVVTDKRRARFRVFRALGQFVGNWFKEKKEEYEESRRPKHFVERATLRKEVITKAAKTAELAPVDDHKKVTERLKGVERVTGPSKIRFKEAAALTPTWQHFGEDTQNDVDTVVTHEQTPPKKIVSQPKTPVTPPVKPEPAPAPLPTQTTIPEETEPRMIVPQAPVVDTPSSQSPHSKLSPLTLVIAVVVFCVTGTLGIGTAVWLFSGNGNTNDIAKPTERLVRTEVQTPVTLAGSKTDFLSAVTDAISNQSSPGVVEIYPVIDSEVAKAGDVFNTLQLSAPGNFTRAVTDITFGSINGGEAFIIMKFTSFDTVFAGLLQWEPNMLTDLTPLFGQPGQVTRIDTSTANRDVRVLVDQQTNEDRITYGFINKNTLLITTNRNIYATLAPAVQ